MMFETGAFETEDLSFWVRGGDVDDEGVLSKMMPT
jgi:hypothetical protein